MESYDPRDALQVSSRFTSAEKSFLEETSEAFDITNNTISTS